eukprot:gene11467-4631_t
MVLKVKALWLGEKEIIERFTSNDISITTKSDNRYFLEFSIYEINEIYKEDYLIFVVYDIAKPESLQFAEKVLSENKPNSKSKLILIGHLQNVGERKIWTKTGDEFSERHHCDFFFEMINDVNLESKFQTILHRYFEENKKKKRFSFLSNLFQSNVHSGASIRDDSDDPFVFSDDEHQTKEPTVSLAEYQKLLKENEDLNKKLNEKMHFKKQTKIENQKSIEEEVEEVLTPKEAKFDFLKKSSSFILTKDEEILNLKSKVLYLQNQLNEGTEFISHLKNELKGKPSTECEQFLIKRKKKQVEEGIIEEYQEKERNEKKLKELEEMYKKSIIVKYPGHWKEKQTKIMIKLNENQLEYQIMNFLMNRNLGDHSNKYGVTVNKKEDPKSFKILSIYRNQNSDLWCRYQIKKHLITNSYHGHLPNFQESKYLQKNKTLVPCLDSNSNEYWMFHGTQKEYVSVLINDGYDPRVGSLIGMFGAGFYLAENSTKSNQYIACSNCGKGCIFKKKLCTCTEEPTLVMLIYRVTLGHPHIALQYSKEIYRGFGDGIDIEGVGKMYSRSEFGRAVRRPPNKPGSFEAYDSLIGEKMEFGGDTLKYREFVLYEKDQAYPEYIIEYKRSEETLKLDDLSEEMENFIRKSVENQRDE